MVASINHYCSANKRDSFSGANVVVPVDGHPLEVDCFQACKSEKRSRKREMVVLEVFVVLRWAVFSTSRILR
ncbi:hypothetical protein TcasGA2_TC002676 [Tribolium castaneum]|uniref:Uncharacterized protein n=1 Tax=Tribolium castaneum TaxID=7070 RepID=D6WEC0_TRICA|nr:hypothetical protein TcasGA2_TC002676 [Tribolium castaneum]